MSEMTTDCAPAGASDTSCRPLRVLVVDDDSFMLDVLADMLAALGHVAVHTESDARLALATLAAIAPDLLICDLSMPGMDGIEFLRAAADAAFGGKVLLLSGVAPGVRRAAERLARAHGLDILGAFKKPLGMPDLEAAAAAARGAMRTR